MHKKGVDLTAAQRRQLAKARGDRTQVEVAKAIGVTSQHLCQMESGKKQPSFQALRLWSEAVGLKLQLTMTKS